METHLVTAPALPAKAGPALTRSIPRCVRLDDDDGRRKHERDYGAWVGAPVTVSWTDRGLGWGLGWPSRRDKVSCVMGGGGTDRIFPLWSVSWCHASVNVRLRVGTLTDFQ